MEKLIWFHQNIISPVDGPRSHYKPSSSAYMMQAIRKHGFFKGYLMGCDRLLRENEAAWVYRTAIIDGKVWKIDPP
jgi:putative component of membrane protein insertase Oxa1/YidC/SpoIIIJ protein YidD